MKKLVKIITFLSFNVLFSYATDSVALENEALRQGKNFFYKKILKCRDMYYLQGEYKNIIEFEGLLFKVVETPLTESDKKNGIQWKGRVNFEASVYREYKKFGNWSQYFDWKKNYTGSLPDGIYQSGTFVELIKYKEKWFFDENPLVSINKNNLKKQFEIKPIELKCDLSYKSMTEQLFEKDKREENKKIEDNNLANRSAVPSVNLGKFILEYKTEFNGKVTSELNITDIGFKYSIFKKDNLGSINTGYYHCWFGSLDSISYYFHGPKRAYCIKTTKRHLNMSHRESDSGFFHCQSYEFCAEDESQVKDVLNLLNATFSSWKKNNTEVYQRGLYPKNPRF